MDVAEADLGLPPEREAEIRASFARQALLRTLGARLIGLSRGRCTLELPRSELALQQQGFFHGGVIGALADTAGGYAAATLLPPGSEVLSAEYKINFLRPGRGERLVADAVVLRAGRTLTVVRVDVSMVADGRQLLCAASQQSVTQAFRMSR